MKIKRVKAVSGGEGPVDFLVEVEGIKPLKIREGLLRKDSDESVLLDLLSKGEFEDTLTPVGRKLLDSAVENLRAGRPVEDRRFGVIVAGSSSAIERARTGIGIDVGPLTQEFALNLRQDIDRAVEREQKIRADRKRLLLLRILEQPANSKLEYDALARQASERAKEVGDTAFLTEVEKAAQALRNQRAPGDEKAFIHATNELLEEIGVVKPVKFTPEQKARLLKTLGRKSGGKK